MSKRINRFCSYFRPRLLSFIESGHKNARKNLHEFKSAIQGVVTNRELKQRYIDEISRLTEKRTESLSD
ncbi:MAG: hypothetical protein AB1442_11915 [Nitrospirota bacterium]